MLTTSERLRHKSSISAFARSCFAPAATSGAYMRMFVSTNPNTRATLCRRRGHAFAPYAGVSWSQQDSVQATIYLFRGSNLVDQFRNWDAKFHLLRSSDDLFGSETLFLHTKTSFPRPRFCFKLNFRLGQKPEGVSRMRLLIVITENPVVQNASARRGV